MNKRIPVAEPCLWGNEKKYVLDCLDSTWISSNGQYIERFEEGFASFCGVKHAIACCNGTVALHAALLALSVGAGDEVIVPSLTYVASANAVAYCGAKPVLVDSEEATWNLDPRKLDELLTDRTRGIMAVHLYGHPADMDPIRDFARRHGLFVLEDAAEAHGALYKGVRTGGLSDVSTFSFYGNKIVTCGEGGMVLTNHADLAARVRMLHGQGMDPARRYWFPIVGYNYRMTNLAAAIGLAQLENIDRMLEKKRWVADRYRQHLAGIAGIALQAEMPWARNVYWMNTVMLDPALYPQSRDAIMAHLAGEGVETRPVFPPMHVLPPYEPQNRDRRFPIADRLSANGFNIPSSANLEEADIVRVCETLAQALGKESRNAPAIL